MNRILRKLTKLYYWLLIRLTYHALPRPCPVCGSERREAVSARERFGFPVRFSRCRDCTLIYQSPFPTTRFLDRFYIRDYYRGLYWGTHTAPHGDRIRREKQALARAQFIKERLALPGTPTIVDYGAGIGALSGALRTLFPGAHVLETDPGTDIGTARTLTPHSVDLVTLIHVLEHLFDPRATLESFKKLLTPGGLVMIEVPNAAHLSERDFHIAHVTYFSRESLSRLASECGFIGILCEEGEGGRVLTLVLRAL